MSKTAGSLSDSLRNAILRGELEPGSPLRQDQLASALGVSKIPLREALQRLTAEGLAAFDANRGFAVATLSAERADEIYRLRAAIEPLLLERAIPNLTIVDIAKAELALSDDDGASPEANFHFHHSLYMPAGWDHGLRMVRTLHASVGPYLLTYLDDPEAAAASAVQHRLLLDYCRAGAVGSALAVLRTHLSQARTSLVASLAAEDAEEAGGE